MSKVIQFNDFLEGKSALEKTLSELTFLTNSFLAHQREYKDLDDKFFAFFKKYRLAKLDLIITGEKMEIVRLTREYDRIKQSQLKKAK